MDLDRRELLELAAKSALFVPLIGCKKTPPESKSSVVDREKPMQKALVSGREQLVLVAALDAIIPASPGSPGALDAKVDLHLKNILQDPRMSHLNSLLSAGAQFLSSLANPKRFNHSR